MPQLFYGGSVWEGICLFCMKSQQKVSKTKMAEVCQSDDEKAGRDEADVIENGHPIRSGSRSNGSG
jgi:hypothetical protein